MDSPARCVTQRAIRKKAQANRVNRGMRVTGIRIAIIITGAAALLAVPSVMLLAPKPSHPLAALRPSPVARDREDPISTASPAGPLPTTAPSASATPAVSARPAATPIKLAPAPTRPAPPPPPPAVPSFAHVFIIVMENHEYGSIIGNASAPYINSLAANYGLATNYYAASHPSLPNYLALTAGSTFGVASDCTTCFVSASNIGDQVEASGRSWKAYM
jgi:hypothetical protein